MLRFGVRTTSFAGGSLGAKAAGAAQATGQDNLLRALQDTQLDFCLDLGPRFGGLLQALLWVDSLGVQGAEQTFLGTGLFNRNSK